MRIDVVIIGLNTEATLRDCIRSVLACSNGGHELQVFYVDSGSTDGSIAIAQSFGDVTILPLQGKHPAPGAARNLGWRAGNAPFVQFLDSDTQLDPKWFDQALTAMGEGVGAVRGLRRERYPNHSVYNWIADQEWNEATGECDTFGGDALVRRTALEETGGYDPELVGGEDPELSERVRKAGWKVLQLSFAMTLHDLAMTSARQYWRRAYRTGYGYAAVIARHAKSGFWGYEVGRIVTRGGVGPFLLLAGMAAGVSLHPGFVSASGLGILLLFYPLLFRWRKIREEKGLTSREAGVYATHCSLVVVPEFFGVLRFAIGHILDCPLRIKHRRPTRGFFARLWNQLAALAALFFVAGCASIEPGVYDYTKEDCKSRRAKFNWENRFRSDEEKEKIVFASESQLAALTEDIPREYLLGPGDKLSILVRDRPEVSLDELTVSPDGYIAMPRLGMLRVVGKPVPWLVETIRTGLEAYYQGPDVTILVREYYNNKVFVLGRVDKPGLVSFAGTGTLLEAIAMAGGMSTVAQNSFLSQAVIFRGKEKVIWIDLKDLLNNGNRALNIPLKNNDLVFIPESHDELVYVMGEVRNPGAIKLTSELSVLDLIMMAGATTEHAQRNMVFLIRNSAGKGYVQQIGMDQILARADFRQDFSLEDGDIVYVSSKPLHQINYFLTQLSPSLSYLDFANSLRQTTAVRVPQYE